MPSHGAWRQGFDGLRVDPVVTFWTTGEGRGGQRLFPRHTKVYFPLQIGNALPGIL
ncbi:MAG: hypothetical protein LBO00_04070 [Zoogloeaceae bacterium]|jgi:hypothetical protein|nr:hypothetical protein [Zoogloeaceae bacterium]